MTNQNTHTLYIALGSNVGNRILNLQQAVYMVSFAIGEVKELSSVYRTPAWGFLGDEFLNACVSVSSEYPPEECMRRLLTIEETMGRERHPDKIGYQNRLIDLDILFYDKKIIETKLLSLPHPRIPERRFVLKPLSDIAFDFQHPTQHKTIGELLDICKDISDIEKIEKSLMSPQSIFSCYNYIAIEGNIGSGKTTLATLISEQYNAKLILERYADNPFLPKFYEDNERYGFALEMSFLADRYHQMTEQLNKPDLFTNFIISDYDIFKSLIFAGVTLSEEEFSLYRKLFFIMYSTIVKPDLYVYLYQNTSRLLQNIQKRGRAYEQSIPAEYLNSINKGYQDFIKSHPDLNVLVIDVSEMDFVENVFDYYLILSKIVTYASFEID